MVFFYDRAPSNSARTARMGSIGSRTSFPKCQRARRRRQQSPAPAGGAGTINFRLSLFLAAHSFHMPASLGRIVSWIFCVAVLKLPIVSAGTLSK